MPQAVGVTGEPVKDANPPFPARHLSVGGTFASTALPAVTLCIRGIRFPRRPIRTEWNFQAGKRVRALLPPESLRNAGSQAPRTYHIRVCTLMRFAQPPASAPWRTCSSTPHFTRGPGGGGWGVNQGLTLCLPATRLAPRGVSFLPELFLHL